MRPRKYFFLFVIFGLFALISLYPKISLATIIGSGCERDDPVMYETECGDESFSIGGCDWECCDTDCCSWDEDGNCDGYCCVDHCWDCHCQTGKEWDEYKCSSPDCDENIEIRTCEVYKSGSCNGGCTNERCCVDCSEGDLCEQCGSWQKPVSNSCGTPDCEEWCITRPECKCCGECIETPSGLRYYDNPNYPTDPCDPEGGIGSADIKLPVKLDWDDVEGWKNGWCSGSTYELADACGNMGTAASPPDSTFKQCCRAKEQDCIEEKSAEIDWDELSACEKRQVISMIEDDCIWTQYQVECLHEVWEGAPVGPEPSTDTATCVTEDCPGLNLRYNPSEMVQYYEITIEGEMRDSDGSAMSSFTKRLEQSEFIPDNPCFFKSNRDYEWSVRACCGNGDCGDAVTSTFSTSLAPEPVWPYDPDWAGGPGRAEPTWKTLTVDDPYPVHLEWCSVDEAKSYCIRMYEEGVPFCPTLFSELFCPAVVPPDEDFPIQTYFDFGLDVFTKETDYQWKVSTCLNDEIGYQCGLGCPGDEICYMFETLDDDPGCCEFSQLWKFFGHVTLSDPELVSPEDGGCVNLAHELRWTHVPGANSYRYEIYQINGGPSLLINEPVNAESVSVRYLWDDKGILTIKENYGWRVQPCWDENGLNCEDDSWSNGGVLWKFTTTGAAPTGLDPPNGAVDVLIPIKLNWDDMACAASYRYELEEQGVGIIATGTISSLWAPASEVSISYDSGTQPLKQDTDYLWRVKTCADTAGNDDFCGQWASGSFRTFILGAPQGPQPCDNCKFYTDEHYLRWDSVLGAAFYRYILDGGAETIVPSNFVFIDTATLALGSHEWSVQPCLDKNCLAPGPPASISTWHFELEEGESAGKGGIVPCGRYTDNPNTPWNEREHCGIKHFFIMIFAIIDFLLWKLIPIALVLLALASGVIFYFSGQLGITDPPSQVKSLWKAAGIGLAVVFLAWIGISLILGLFGYQAGLLGPWWKISF